MTIYKKISEETWPKSVVGWALPTSQAI